MKKNEDFTDCKSRNASKKIDPKIHRVASFRFTNDAKCYAVEMVRRGSKKLNQIKAPRIVAYHHPAPKRPNGSDDDPMYLSLDCPQQLNNLLLFNTCTHGLLRTNRVVLDTLDAYG